MTDKLTWFEFAEKYQPKDGDKFLDDRGNEWVYESPLGSGLFRHGPVSIGTGYAFSGRFLTCLLIPPKQKVKKQRTVWLNVYDNDMQTVYSDQETARASAFPEVIETVEVTFEYEVRE